MIEYSEQLVFVWGIEFIFKTCMRSLRKRKPETAFTREMRQVASFLECFREKSRILKDSPHLAHINQVFLESDFNFGSEPQPNEPIYEEAQKLVHHEHPSTNSEVPVRMSQSGDKTRGLVPGNNVHNMNRHPKSIGDLLKNPNEAHDQEQTFPANLDYSETDQATSQKVSNLWRDSKVDPNHLERLSRASNLQRNTSQNIDALFDNSKSHLMGHKKNDFLNRIHYLNRAAQEQSQHAEPSQNVFVNSNHLQMQKMHLMDQLSENQVKNSRDDHEEPRNEEMGNPIQIKQAESFYEVDTGNRYNE